MGDAALGDRAGAADCAAAGSARAGIEVLALMRFALITRRMTEQNAYMVGRLGLEPRT